MRIIARSSLSRFWEMHPQTRAPLHHWLRLAAAAFWENPQDVVATFPKAKALNGERVRFEVSGGDFRMIVAFDFGRQIAFIKFLGTHSAYDRVDALTVSEF